MKPTVAVVLFGQPRFINSRMSHLSLKFCLWRQGIRPSYYGHAWHSQKSTNQKTSPWSGVDTNTAVPANAREIIGRLYPNASIRFDEPREFSNTSLTNEIWNAVHADSSHKLRQEFERLRATPEVMYNNTASQLYSIHEAIAAQKESAKDYDVVLLTRWDNFVWKLPDLNETRSSGLTISSGNDFGFADLLMITNSRNIVALDSYISMDRYFLEWPTMTAEHVKKMSYLDVHTLDSVSFTDKLIVDLIRGSSKRILWTLLVRRILSLKVPNKLAKRLAHTLQKIRDFRSPKSANKSVESV
jgi:hypothetical protein